MRLPLCLECVQKQPIKQTLRDLRHGPLVSMTTPEGDETDDSDAETPWDDSDAGKDKLRNAFGNHDLSGNFSDKTMLATAWWQLKCNVLEAQALSLSWRQGGHSCMQVYAHNLCTTCVTSSLYHDLSAIHQAVATAV